MSIQYYSFYPSLIFIRRVPMNHLPPRHKNLIKTLSSTNLERGREGLDPMTRSSVKDSASTSASPDRSTLTVEHPTLASSSGWWLKSYLDNTKLRAMAMYLFRNIVDDAWRTLASNKSPLCKLKVRSIVTLVEQIFIGPSWSEQWRQRRGDTH